MAALIVSLTLAVVLGFAAHRASICTVRAVGEAMSARTFAMFASIGKSVLWIVAVTVPFFWLLPATAAGLSGWQLSGVAIAGGFLFGLGAGINGACAYSTMARLVDGEIAMAIAVVGFAAGVYAFTGLVDAAVVARPLPTPALVGEVLDPALAVALLLVVWAAFEARRLWRTRPAGASLRQLVLTRQYRLSTAALLMGVTGAAILLLFGSAGYTSTFELVIEGALGTKPWPAAGRWLLLVAVLGGMLLSTLHRGGFRVDWRPRLGWLRNLAGGALMGLGVALAPGGNDALVLYGLPSLSPHAIPAFAALAIGVVAALILMRNLFGIETRVVCKNDVYLSDWGLGARKT